MNRIGSLVALAATMLLSACAGQGTPATPAAPEAAPTAWTTAPVDCASLPAEVDAPDSLDSGIARISVCNEPRQDAMFNQWAPVDALIVNPDAVAEAYNAAERFTSTMACPADLGSAYRMVVEYPDGRVVQLRGEMFGCRVVGNRVAAQQVLAAFSTALTAQRAAQPVEAADRVQGAQVCTVFPRGSWVTADLADTVKGLVCANGQHDPARGVISGADWETIRTDLAANARQVTEQAPAPACDQPVNHSVVAVSRTGDVVVLNGQCGWYSWNDGATGNQMVWQPGEAAKAALGR